MKQIDGKLSLEKGNYLSMVASNDIQSYFLNVLKDYLNDAPTLVRDDLDWNLLKTIADNHQVSAIFYRQTKQPIFQSAYSQQIFRYANYQKVIYDFKKCMEEHQYVFVKGIALAELYPLPALRSMGDVDVIIPQSEREAVNKSLLDANFKLKEDSEFNMGEWTYSKNDYLFEVHDSLVHRYDGMGKLVDYFSHVWEHVKDHQLDWSFHLIYLLEHLRQHIVGCGAGFRQFMDIAIVCKKSDINWPFVKEELAKIGLYAFACNVFSLNRRWFDVPSPFKEQSSEEFYASATQKIFDNGVFGFNDDKNIGTDIAFRAYYQRLYHGLDAKAAKRHFIRERIFPSYKTMSLIPEFSYVKKSKLLLPFAWIHRLFYRTFDKKKRDNALKQLNTDKVRERMEMFKEWGL